MVFRRLIVDWDFMESTISAPAALINFIQISTNDILNSGFSNYVRIPDASGIYEISSVEVNSHYVHYRPRCQILDASCDSLSIEDITKCNKDRKEGNTSSDLNRRSPLGVL